MFIDRFLPEFTFLNVMIVILSMVAIAVALRLAIPIDHAIVTRLPSGTKYDTITLVDGKLTVTNRPIKDGEEPAIIKITGNSHKYVIIESR